VPVERSISPKGGNTLDEIRDCLQFLEDHLDIPAYVGVTRVARRLAVSASFLRSHFFLLPEFGVTAVPGKLLWPLAVAREWLRTTPADRQRQWDLLPVATKKAIQRKRG